MAWQRYGNQMLRSNKHESLGYRESSLNPKWAAYIEILAEGEGILEVVVEEWDNE